MRQYFVDAWLVIAALDRKDQHHDLSRQIGESVAAAQLVTHDAIFTEVLAYFCDEGARARKRAVEAVRSARQWWTVLPVDRQLYDRALDLYDARPDKEYSLTDCMSMVLMRDLGIHHVLTNDHHFSQAGFIVVNE